MEINIMILAIIVTSVATFISRFSGAITSEKVKAKSKTFEWFNCVAYATLAALVARMVIFPAGILGDFENDIWFLSISISSSLSES